jgi:hypothetical protein
MKHFPILATLLPASAHQNQTTVEGHPGALEIDLKRTIEGELKGPVCVSRHLRTAPIASKPTPISAIRAFYQITSSLRCWKSGSKDFILPTVTHKWVRKRNKLTLH